LTGIQRSGQKLCLQTVTQAWRDKTS
jgi:hypothetical protein